MLTAVLFFSESTFFRGSARPLLDSVRISDVGHRIRRWTRKYLEISSKSLSTRRRWTNPYLLSVKIYYYHQTTSWLLNVLSLQAPSWSLISVALSSSPFHYSIWKRLLLSTYRKDRWFSFTDICPLHRVRTLLQCDLSLSYCGYWWSPNLSPSRNWLDDDLPQHASLLLLHGHCWMDHSLSVSFTLFHNSFFIFKASISSKDYHFRVYIIIGQGHTWTRCDNEWNSISEQFSLNQNCCNG